MRMAEVLPYYLVGIPPFGVLLVLVRAHVAAQNSGIMVRMGILNAALNFAGNAVLGKLLGLRGIALSTSLVHALLAVLLHRLLALRLAELDGTGRPEASR
jgi:putative peptidoglycan lipid II flippase